MIHTNSPFLSVRLLGPIALLLPLTGCQRAPSFDILGSFFPVWFFCIVGGIFLMLACRYLLIRTGLDQEIGPLVLMYPCLTALFAFSLWLVFFSR